VDGIVCAHTPDPFHAVGLWYDDFAPTSDDEVRQLLAEADAALTPVNVPNNEVRREERG
jgi:putative phosphoribosyl transferase